MNSAPRPTGTESVVDAPIAPRGSKTLEMLGIRLEDLLRARGDSILLETLRSTHDLLAALRSGHVLDAFLQLPSIDRTNFLRWIASAGDVAARRSRTRSFVTALESSPLSSAPSESRVIDVTDLDTRAPADPSVAGEDRDRAAEARDDRAEIRDEVASDRDDQAEARDERAEVRDRLRGSPDPAAASDRSEASVDRSGGESDRVSAAEDRSDSATDRQASAGERVISSIDELTGAYQRSVGLLALGRELTKSQRTERPMVVAFVDVDGLKEVNDSFGHAAGDVLLRETVRAMRGRLRAYDLIIRFGGDEFVCALSELSLSTAAERFRAVNADLARDGRGSITVGLADMRPRDTIEELIARADVELYRQRGRARTHPL